MKPPEKVYVCAFYCGRRLQKNNILNIKDSKNRKATGLWKKPTIMTPQNIWKLKAAFNNKIAGSQTEAARKLECS